MILYILLNLISCPYHWQYLFDLIVIQLLVFILFGSFFSYYLLLNVAGHSFLAYFNSQWISSLGNEWDIFITTGHLSEMRKFLVFTDMCIHKVRLLHYRTKNETRKKLYLNIHKYPPHTLSPNPPTEHEYNSINIWLKFWILMNTLETLSMGHFVVIFIHTFHIQFHPVT